MTQIKTPTAFHVMAKPTGSSCNLNCSYCFFLKKDRLYPGSTFRMSGEVQEAYIRQLLQAHRSPQVNVAWQGGEPTLMGLDFFRRAIELEKMYQSPGTIIENTFQTNGILLNDEWCRFFHENRFLVGLSLDGPGELHDTYRRDRGGRGTFERVMRAVRLLQKHRVEFNILCTINSKNADHPLKVYRFFRDEVRAQFIQFIPIVERDNESGCQEGDRVTDRSIRPGQFGRFLTEIFDEWVKKDVGRTFVQTFDGALAGWLGSPGTVCIFGPTCGQGMALEHNGDLYSCDHFVEPAYLLGNIMKTPMIELAASEKQRKFGQDKLDTMPRYCLKCEVRFACNGECPKNRFMKTPEGEPGLNYLCEGFRQFFRHVDPAMKIMADLILQGRLAEEIMQVHAPHEAVRAAAAVRTGRNDPCPCGSGKKFKHCHGSEV
jgi:uncharacterized protein